MKWTYSKLVEHAVYNLPFLASSTYPLHRQKKATKFDLGMQLVHSSETSGTESLLKDRFSLLVLNKLLKGIVNIKTFSQRAIETMLKHS